MILSRSRISSLFFLLFFVVVIAQKSNYLITILTGINIEYFFGGVSFMYYSIFVFFLAYIFSRKYSLLKSKKIFIYLFIYSNLLLLLGFLLGNAIFNILIDYWIMILITISYLFGKDIDKWNLFRKELVVLFYFSAMLVLLGTVHLSSNFLEFSDKAGNISTATIAYNISPILDIWPFIFLLKFFESRKIKDFILAVLPFLIYFAFQLFFLKRAPSIRALTFLIVAVVLYMYLRGNIRIVLKLLLLSLLVGILTTIYFPADLIERFSSIESDRLNEALGMVSQMTIFSHFFGNGLGGFFYNDYIGGAIVVDSDGSMGKYIIHIGALYPYLKGGIILMFLIYILYINTIYRALRRARYLSSEELTALCYLIVYGLFRLIEGPPSTGAIFDGVLFGMSLGILSGHSLKKYKLN
jgi:hypothetical protein